MCGRYTLVHSTEEILDRFGLRLVKFQISPRFNIAPSQLVPIVISDRSAEAVGDREGEGEGGNLLQAARWGFVPSWSRDLSRTPPMINARSESAAEKPTFRTAFRARRCIIPADSFYEWEGEGKSRKPWRFALKSGEMFGFAGLFEDWASRDGDEIRTCAILTVGANAMMQRFHDRMPVILPRQLEGQWLDPRNKDVANLEALMRPYPDDLMTLHRVSTAVNGTKIDSAELIEEIDAELEEAAMEAAKAESKTEKPPKAAPRKRESPGQLSLFDLGGQ